MESVQERNDKAIAQFEGFEKAYKALVTQYQLKGSLDLIKLDFLVAEIDSCLLNFEWYSSYRPKIFKALNGVHDVSTREQYLSSTNGEGLTYLLWDLHEILVKKSYESGVPEEAAIFWRDRWKKGKTCYIVKSHGNRPQYKYSIYTKAAGIDTHWFKINVYEDSIEIEYNDESLYRLWLFSKIMNKRLYVEFPNTRSKVIVGRYFSFSCSLFRVLRNTTVKDELEFIEKVITNTRDLNFLNFKDMLWVYELNSQQGWLGRPLIILFKWVAYLRGDIKKLVTIEDEKYKKQFYLEDLYDDIRVV